MGALKLFCFSKNIQRHIMYDVRLAKRLYATVTATPLRSVKKKSLKKASDFIDSRVIRVNAGKGGDGAISFLQLFANDRAGPDGGDGGNGAHVIFEADQSTRGLDRVKVVINGANGEKGYGKDCNGHSADHTIIPVPVGTIFKNDVGRIIADLYEERMMFLAARGGAGGKGNHFFASDLQPAPKIAEVGADGEKLTYTLELSSIAHFGLLGFPNAGKSTLLQAVTRANPKVAPYPFTTLKPHLGTIQFDDMEQLIIADLPGIIEGSHKNKGLGITFLRHAERCLGLLILLDMSEPEQWENLNILRNEVLCFSSQLSQRPQIIVANKMDCPESEENFHELSKKIRNELIVPISAKHGQNLNTLLTEMRRIYDVRLASRNVKLQEDRENVVNDMLG